MLMKWNGLNVYLKNERCNEHLWPIRVILSRFFHKRVATTHLGNHNRPKKVYNNHWPGVYFTYHAATTVKRFINVLEKRQSLGLYLAVSNYREFTNRSQRFDKSFETPGTVLPKLSHGSGCYWELARQCLNLWEESKTLMSSWKN